MAEPACLAFDGATDTARFETHLEQCQVSALRPGAIVVMDDLACPKTAEVERLIRSAGATSRYLPASGPDLNPIEKTFSKLKGLLRTAAARTVGDLIEAIGHALRGIRPGDIVGWFRNCGYQDDPSNARVSTKLV